MENKSSELRKLMAFQRNQEHLDSKKNMKFQNEVEHTKDNPFGKLII